MKLEKKKYNILDIIRIPLIYSSRESILVGIKYILDGIIPILQVLVTAKFLDIAIQIFNHKKQFDDIIKPIIFMIVLLSYIWFSKNISEYLEICMSNKLRRTFRVDLIEKVASLKYKYIENENSSNLISKVMKEPEVQCSDAYILILDMVQLIIEVMGILIILFSKVWWSAVLIVLISIPLFKLSLKSGSEIYETNRKVEGNKRRAKYLLEVLNNREFVEERELFQYSKDINKDWFEQFEISRKSELKVSVKWFINMKLGGAIISILSIVIVFILIFPVVEGKITIGFFISIVNSIFSLINYMAWTLPQYGDNLAQNKEFLADLSEFMFLDENPEYLSIPSKERVNLKKLEFKNVFFKYPGTKNYILKDLSFVIEGGKNYAFVGSNGAGKTTITKLITGLYEEFEGEILINDQSIKIYNQEELKSMFSVVYQDFARYYISVKDNILLGDVSNDISLEKLYIAINNMDLNESIENLNNGLDSNLGKIKIDGVDLSGGQWQRIAMARSIINCASLRILDEPTAALDPISESNIYEKFHKISKNSTTIFISHRLGSTKLADKIFVMEDGKIVESGSYKNLIANDGVYAKMYESQRSWYK
ncbi:ABC transporter ATP-binding protein [Clostridium ihumii]|uniref:ABC transporter ATP-binding protein n=1 Tax=Clostridium ihumii TaxID=1470356 RepID=UPI003D32EBC4